MKAAAAATAMLLAAALAAAMAPFAHAGPCDDEIKVVDAALARTDLAADVKAQLADMRAQAQKLCAAGNEEEAADVLAEASSILEGQ